MKPDFIFTLIVALGATVCATYALPLSSEIRKESDDGHTSLQEDLLSVVANSQGGENTMHSVGQSAGRIMNAAFGHIQKGFKFGRKFGQALKGVGNLKFGRKVGRAPKRPGIGRKFGFGRALRGAGNFIRNHRRGIAKGFGRYTGELLGTLWDRDTGGYYPDAAPIYYYPSSPPIYPPPSYRYPDTAPGYPDTAPKYPDTAPGYPDTAPKYPNKAPDYSETVPRNPDEAPGSPKDSVDGGQSQPGGDETADLPSEEEEMALAELLELAKEQAAQVEHDSSTKKQNEFRQRRRGFTYKVKRFFKDLYQAINL